MFGLTIWGAVTLSAGVLLSVLFAHRIITRESDLFIRRVIALAFVGKLVGTSARGFVLEFVYSGVGDASRYLSAGTAIAGQLRARIVPEQMWEPGTAFMEFLTGVLFAITQPSVLIAFLFFSMLSFIGSYLFLRGFTIAFPEGDRRRYAVLVLLLPTMLYWPSSLGKEAWLIFALGITAYGAARLLRRQAAGYLLSFLGIFAVFMIRPHIAALVAASLAAAFVLRFRDPEVKRGAVAWFVGLFIVGAGAGFAVVNFDRVVPGEGTLAEGLIDEVLEETARRTEIGGSNFDTQPVTSPASFARALITVAYRPFPFEAHNPQAFIASLEGLALLALTIMAIPRWRRFGSILLRRPYVAMALGYSLGFIIAFANIGNFGILVRQRAQLLPFLAVLLCLPTARQLLARRQEEAAGPEADVASEGADRLAPISV